VAAAACDSDGRGALLLSACGATFDSGVWGATAAVSRGTLESVLPILPRRGEAVVALGVPAVF
jgi:hypothetical protein